MRKMFKQNMKYFVCVCIGIIIGLSCIISYANSFNSSEISYDTSTSGAVQSNVKDALDFLYNKTKSGASAECPENMSCIEKPGVVMNVTGPGTVDKGTVYVGLNESNTFTVTPNEGYVLGNISCDNGYTLGSFKTYDNSTQAESEVSQTITINNPGTTSGAICTITFKSKEISVKSSGNYDKCNNNGDNCICYKIKNNISNFTYESHTGCNFKSTSCSYNYDNRGIFNCGSLYWNTSCDGWGDYGAAVCSGVITCAT